MKRVPGIAILLLLAAATAVAPEEPAPPPSSCKPTAPIDASLTIEPAGQGCVRLTLKATARADLEQAAALLNIDPAHVADGSPTWSGRLKKGQSITLSCVCTAPAGECCVFSGGVVGRLAGGGRVIAPVQVVHNEHLQHRDDGGRPGVNRLGQAILEYDGVTGP